MFLDLSFDDFVLSDDLLEDAPDAFHFRALKHGFDAFSLFLDLESALDFELVLLFVLLDF